MIEMEIYAVSCANGDTLTLRCDTRNCRVLRQQISGGYGVRSPA